MVFRRILVTCVGLIVLGSIARAADVTGALTFVGITPCRIIDSRGNGFSGQWGPPILANGTSRTFQITGATSGVPIPCGIPSNAVAIAANFIATQFTGAGDLRVFPAGGATPVTSILNYALENISNAASVPLGPVGGGENGISVVPAVSNTHLIVDLNGYYVPRPVTITLTDSAGSTTSLTPATIASIYSGNFRSQGHDQARLVARFNNLQQVPACDNNIAVELVQTVSCNLTTGGTVLATLTRNCGSKAWLEYSTPFTIPTGALCLDLRAGAPNGGTASWRVIELELMR